ncbi:MAG: hypothetical protein KF855_08770 [Acidobacteria bacterium]|nr:hypothetical protein [Acidobacteriota bacterium]
MNFVDLLSLALHRAVAEKMLADEKRVLKIARDNIDRWLSSPERKGQRNLALMEWKEILETRSADEIRKIISTNDDEGQRLRSSSPFTGIITQEERTEIYDACAKIVPV